MPNCKLNSPKCFPPLPSVDAFCSSTSTPESRPSLTSLPQEVLDEIAGHLDPTSKWMLKFSCRSVDDGVRGDRPTRPCWRECQKVYESNIRQRRLLARACHSCHKVRFIAQFSDDQRDPKKTPEPLCIACMINRGSFDFGKRFTVNGVLCWPCFGCNAAKPLTTVQPTQQAHSEKRFCPDCWAKRIHLTMPLTSYAGNSIVW